MLFRTSASDAFGLRSRSAFAVSMTPLRQKPHCAALRAILQVAAGWYFFGRENQAEPILQAARGVLLSGDLAARAQTQLACAYSSALGQEPVEDGGFTLDLDQDAAGVVPHETGQIESGRQSVDERTEPDALNHAMNSDRAAFHDGGPPRRTAATRRSPFRRHCARSP